MMLASNIKCQKSVLSIDLNDFRYELFSFVSNTYLRRQGLVDFTSLLFVHLFEVV